MAIKRLVLKQIQTVIKIYNTSFLAGNHYCIAPKGKMPHKHVQKTQTIDSLVIVNLIRANRILILHFMIIITYNISMNMLG